MVNLGLKKTEPVGFRKDNTGNATRHKKELNNNNKNKRKGKGKESKNETKLILCTDRTLNCAIST